MRISGRELDGILEQIALGEQRQFIPAALICSVIANVHRDPEQRDEPFTIQDFLPGGDGPKSKEEEMIKWLEAIERGEELDDPEAIARFKRKMKSTFNNLSGGAQKLLPEVTTVGPSGKEESI